ncbi:MAG: ribosome maturation factor RimM [Bacteroidales bacterium]|nr:ribosome maturation factor RimM [Bacteroidales bacterium]
MSDSGTKGLFQIAQVLKSNGINGELLMSFRDIDPSEIDQHEPVFINFDGLPVPFFIESFTQRGSNKALVKLNDISTLEDAEEIVGRPVFAEEASYEFEDDGYEDLIGWTLFDEKGNRRGEVVDYEDIPGNPCVVVETADGQAMVPLHEDLIISVDEDNQAITMEIPDGLL